ncbi:MAG: acyltransferase, partial [Candidatus Hodarchaeales archaeon]
MGNRVSLNNAILNVSSGHITIGNHVFFGHDVMLVTGTHDYRKVGAERMEAWIKSGRDIIIEDGVFIGSGAIILGNVRIGRNAVVGAGSIVNKDVEPNTLVAGVPAKYIRK